MQVNHSHEEIRTREILTRREAADYLRISPRHLHNLIKAGEIPRVKLHANKQGKVLIRRRDLDAYLDRNLVVER